MKKAIVLLTAIMLLLSACSSSDSVPNYTTKPNIEEGGTIINDENRIMKNQTNDSVVYQISYWDVKVASLLNCSAEEVVDAWGLPSYMDGESLEYEEISVSLSEGKVSSIGGFAEDFAIGSSWLCMTKDEIIQTLGEPDSELDYSYYTDLVYSAPDCELVITITEPGYAEYLVISTPTETSSGFLSDDYVGYDDDSSSYGNSGNNANLDYNLCGRWRSYDSGKSITLDQYGNVSVNWKVWQSYNSDYDSMTWTAVDGRLYIFVYFPTEYQYELEVKDINGTSYEVLYLDMNGVRGNYIRKDTGTLAIEGSWENGQGFLTGPIELYSNGTGVYTQISRGINWYATDDTLMLCSIQGSVYDYTVSGDTLTMFFDDGAEIFTRVGS